MARSRGLPIHRALATARTGLDTEQARLRAEELPLPYFNADRRPMELDMLEAGRGTGPGRVPAGPGTARARPRRGRGR